jgi:predicted TIM-barrel enzyme
MESNFYDVFPKKKILIGMIHLDGRDYQERATRALYELNIYEEEGFDGAIIEDYHGSLEDVENTLKVLPMPYPKIKIGINTLRNPYLAFKLANKYNAKFIQFDTIQSSAGDENNPKRFNEKLYMSLRKKYPEISVFGGVRFKYVPPTGNSLEDDIIDGMYKSDVIVTTGEGTGIETPTQKLKEFREMMGTFPLIVGAGVNDKNIREQMDICNGAIVGSYLKGGNTEAKAERKYVRELVELVRGKS